MLRLTWELDTSKYLTRTKLQQNSRDKNEIKQIKAPQNSIMFLCVEEINNEKGECDVTRKD